mgnify:CR=1 FL=1
MKPNGITACSSQLGTAPMPGAPYWRSSSTKPTLCQATSAQIAAVNAVRPGVEGETVDATARDIIREAGYGEFFGHGTGHGVGLDIHEGPRLAPGVKDQVAPGMVVTLEPGIYIPGWGGVRIEDMVIVTEKGREVLTRSISKELVIL